MATATQTAMRSHPFQKTLTLFLGCAAAVSPLCGLALMTQPLHAEVPASGSAEFRGMYKVASSTDPIFPMESNQEWFLDFGKGVSAGTLSGNVAVSLRQNPNVKVRIMAWQYFPEQTSLLIGNLLVGGAALCGPECATKVITSA